MILHVRCGCWCWGSLKFDFLHQSPEGELRAVGDTWEGESGAHLCGLYGSSAQWIGVYVQILLSFTIVLEKEDLACFGDLTSCGLSSIISGCTWLFVGCFFELCRLVYPIILSMFVLAKRRPLYEQTRRPP